MTAEQDWSWVTSHEWNWNEGSLECGVHTYEGKLVWWSRPFGPTGYMFENGMEQSFDVFLASGEPVSAPAEVIDELNALLTRTGSSESPPSTAG